jgi:iron complex transport system substrate-binding protein
MKRALLIALAFAFAVSAADPPKRIVSLSPNVTEMLYGIGAFGQLVAISDYCTYPPEVAKLPSIGGWRNPDLEKVAALRPDLVITDDAQGVFVKDDFQKLGLKLMIVPNHTVQDVYTAIVNLGAATGHPRDAEKLVASTREGLRRVSSKTAALPKRRVVLIVNRVPGALRDLYTATDGSFLAQLVEIAGGHVAAPPNKRGYAKLSKEDLLAINPEVILDFIHGLKGRLAGDPLEAWSEMPSLAAVRNHRVCGVGEDYVPHASQRIVQTAELFARLIHPEAK